MIELDMTLTPEEQNARVIMQEKRKPTKNPSDEEYERMFLKGF